MGGLYSSAVTKMVTHIVALTTDPDKCQTALNKNLKCKIVLPHWYGTKAEAISRPARLTDMQV